MAEAKRGVDHLILSKGNNNVFWLLQGRTNTTATQKDRMTEIKTPAAPGFTVYQTGREVSLTGPQVDFYGTPMVALAVASLLHQAAVAALEAKP